MADSLLEELDFEDDVEEEQEFYCSVCSECFDEEKEFTEHTNSTQHNAQLEQKLTSLEDGDSFCNLCFVQITDTFEQHCKTDDHCEYLNSIKRCFPSMSEPVEDIYDSTTKKQGNEAPASQTPKAKKANISKSGSIKERILAQKCIGVTHLKRQENLWFCDLCLEKFPDAIDDHCTRARHAIQYIKLFEPETAYKLKVYALQSHLKKKFQALVSSKAQEIFEKEKESPEFLRFMLELDRFEKTVVKSEPKLQKSTKPVVKVTSVKSATLTKKPIISDLQTTPNIDPTEKGSSPDPGEVVSLFEEDDRSFIPSTEDLSEYNRNAKVQKSRRSSGNNIPINAKDSTMIVGITYLKLKGRNYYCSLCDVMCKSSLPSCRGHMTSSLHRRKVITQNSSHPIPNYLEKLRTKDAVLYNRLTKIEARKIEVAERADENTSDMKARAGILSVSNVQCLPESLANVTKLPSDEQKLNLEELAKCWDRENNQQIYSKSHADSPSTTGTNKTAISPIHPQIEDLLVGVNAITHISSSTFHCGLCKIKFTIQAKRKQRPHVTGRLHKLKALALAYGKDVDEYLNYRMKKEGYDTIVNVINQACVPLEKEEIESETPILREIRAKILGVKVEQLPLPMIIMSNEEPFDVKQAAADWKYGKKSASVAKPSVITIAVPKTSVAKTVAEQLLAEANLKSGKKIINSVTKANKSDIIAEPLNDAIITHVDVQSFDQCPKPAEIVIEVKNDRAKNIFDLCKPKPNTTPEKKASKSSKSPSNIKNIDIDVLRKSLVDADFIPVDKDETEKEESTKSQKKTAVEEDTPKSSKSLMSRDRQKSSGSSKPDKKTDHLTSQQNKHQGRSPVQKRSNIVQVKESPRRTYSAARNTYVKAEVSNNRLNNPRLQSGGRNSRENNVPSERPSNQNQRNSRENNVSSERSSNQNQRNSRENNVTSERPSNQNQRNSQNQDQLNRGGLITKTKSDRGLGRDNDRHNASSNRPSNNNNRGLLNQCDQNKPKHLLDQQHSGTYDGRRNQFSSNQSSTNNNFDNSSGGRHQGNRNQQGSLPNNNNRNQYNTPTNNSRNNSSNYSDRNFGNASDRNSGNSRNATDQYYNSFGNNNSSRMSEGGRSLGSANSSAGGRQNPNQFTDFGGSRSNNTAPIAESFDIDMSTMKNTHLSSALAKVTNLGPLNPAHNPQTYHNNRQSQQSDSYQRQSGPSTQNPPYNNRQQPNLYQSGQDTNNYQNNIQNNKSYHNEQGANSNWGNSGRGNEREDNWGNSGDGRNGEQNNTWNNRGNSGGTGGGNQYNQANYGNNNSGRNQHSNNERENNNWGSNNNWQNNDRQNNDRQHNDRQNNDRQNNDRSNNEWGNDRDKGWRNNYSSNTQQNNYDNRVGVKREGCQPYESPQKRPRQFRS